MFHRKQDTKKISPKALPPGITDIKLKSELIQQTISCMHSFGADRFFDTDMDCLIHEDTVDVHIKEGVRIHGSIRRAIWMIKRRTSQNKFFITVTRNSRAGSYQIWQIT